MLEDVRSVSEGVFSGSPYRIEIAAAVYRLGKRDFATVEVRSVLLHDLPTDNTLDRGLKSLSEAGLLKDLSRVGWTRDPDSVFWRFCDEWYQQLVALGRNVRTP